MATRIGAKPSALYERDVYAWSLEQAALLRAGRLDELDLEHLAREVEDVGASLYREVRSRVRTIMEHLLKLEHSPATDPREGWVRTVRAARADLAEDLTPALRPRIEAGLDRFYETARLEAAAALHEHAGIPPPTPSLRPAPTPSTRSPATGGHEAAARPAWRS